MYIRFATIVFLLVLTLAGSVARCAPPAEAIGEPVRKDRFGDPLPAGARARLGTTRLRHGNAIDHIAVSPDGKLLATVGPMDRSKNVIRIWDLTTGRLIRQCGEHREACVVAFSPDGKILVSVGGGGDIYVWRIAAGEAGHRLQGEQANSICSLVFSPDGKTLAAGGKNIALWDVAAGKLLRRIAREGDNLEGLAFSPDGKLLAAEESQILTLWDAVTGRKLRRLEGKIKVPCLAFTPGGKFLAAGGWQDDVGLWDVATGKRVRSFKGHKESVASLAISPDGKILAAGGGRRSSVRTLDSDHSVRLWDIATGRTLRVLPAGRETVFDVAFTPDGKTLITGSEMARLWDVATGERRLAFASHEYKVAGVAFHPEGKVRTVSLDGTSRTWESETGREIHRLALPTPNPSAAALSADGQRIACAAWDGTIQVLDAASGRKVRHLAGKDCVVAGALAFSRDSGLLAVRSVFFKGLRLYRVADGAELLSLPKEKADQLMLSPDGRYLAWQFEDKVSICDTTEGARFPQIKVNGAASALTFSADGRTLIIADLPPVAVHGWEVVSGKRRWLIQYSDYSHFKWDRDFPIHLQLAPDGRCLALGGGTRLQLWDTIRRKRLHLLDGGQDDRLVGLVFSPDGRLLASANWNFSTLIWEVPEMEKEKQPVSRLKDAELAALWSDLGGVDAVKAFQSLHALAEHPPQALALVRERVRPAASPEPQQLKSLITDLESERFEIREKAQKELARLGALARPELRRTLSSRPLLETRRRVETLLEKLQQRKLSTEELRQIRTTELLEQIGSEEARRLLENLAKGAPEAWLTQEAKSSHRRMSRRPTPAPERR